MGVRAKLNIPLKNFLAALDSAMRIYAPLRECCLFNYDNIRETDFHPTVASKMIGLAFLSVVAAWEEYIEEAFLRYMAGTQTDTGYAPVLRLSPCCSLVHARQVLSATFDSQERPRFLPWNDYTWVVSAARVYFRDGEPYSKVANRFRDRLADAQIIRNRVAHTSQKARMQFRKMSNRLAGDHPMSPMNRGFSPGRMLVSQCPEYGFDEAWLASKEHFWGDFFEAYGSMYLDLAATITPYHAA